ncbi:MAG TPA: immunoglobulin domain-containing protein, partial [Verrucomicrobiae bacterium]|nr:immunoglobulin domain-containing protein [Verrucomicrobiae bacterium]
MAANLPGNSQEYGTPQIRILQGLKPDIVCIQEFNYLGNSAAQIRSFVDTAFGPTFQYTRETNAAYQIPNGIISRYPIVAAGSWDDSESPNRGFAWARIDLPGTNDLLAVSVHFLTSDSATRGREAAELRAILQTNVNVPPSGWIVVGGDFNTDSRSEAAITTLTSGNFLSDVPIPADGSGDPDTNLNRNKPYDYALPSSPLAARLTNVVIGASSFPNGLVFDSRVYANLADVLPVQLNDSADGQHMAVIKDFLISSANATNPPAITVQPLSQTNTVGANVTFTVTATGTAPLSYQWRHTTTNVPGATASSLTLTNIQTAAAGVYSVVITNLAGSVTSSNALLVITTTPVITNQPQNQVVNVGENATFTVGATGLAPLGYQWRFGGTNLPGANENSFTRINAQLADAGNYSVVVTNTSGSVTSDVVALTVNPTIPGGIIAQWDFNSVPPDGSTTTGTTAPSTGPGTASLVTALTPTFAGGSATDPASSDNSGWNTTGYPSASSGNKTAGARFDVSTVGKQNLVVRWDQRVSNTGSKYSRLQYTTNGSTFLDFPAAVGVVTATSFEAHTNNLSSLPGVNNNPNFGFRIVNEFENSATGTGANAYVAAAAGSGYAGSGTTRFDMVTLLGDSIPATNPPALPPTLSNAALAGNYFHFVLNGSTGSNYIVQATTDLGLSNWISLQTNP